jgi:hypothetical protein
MARRGKNKTQKRAITKRKTQVKRKRTIRKKGTRMRGGIGVKGVIQTAFQAETSSEPGTAQQFGTIVGSPWKNIVQGKDCSFTGNCNRGIITTPTSVVNRAYSNLPKNLRSLRTIEDDKSLTESEKHTDIGKVLADSKKLMKR